MGVFPASINKNYVFARVYRSKKSFVSPFVITYVLPKKRGEMRVGITASKKIGCAVDRNRARRIVKAAARDLLKNADGCFDIVFVCRRATVAQKSTTLKKVIEKHLLQAGVIS
ncbi:MAG: ribonuclease P protein component [Oscillospiraceae bacterium]